MYRSSVCMPMRKSTEEVPSHTLIIIKNIDGTEEVSCFDDSKRYGKNIDGMKSFYFSSCYM